MTQSEETRPPRIRLGMVGGGRDAFIGAVHRLAARMDDHYEFVAGALSSTPERAQESGRALGLAPDRIYDDYKAMAKREARLKGGIEAVAIVTPNNLHAPVAREFLKRGIHVICDKPLTATLSEAKALRKAAEASDALFVLTHNYTGYPMMRHARAMIRDGLLGEIRVVQVEYAQDWLARPIEEDGMKQAAWRTDPAQTGVGGSTGDIGTHAFNIAAFVTGLTLEAVAADLQSFVPGRRVDDNANVLLRYAGGARGVLWCSQVAAGVENDLRLRVFGSKGGIEWSQESPKSPLVRAAGRAKTTDHPRRPWRRARGGAGQPGSLGPSGGLPRGLRHHLRRGRARHPGAQGRRAAALGGDVSDGRGWRGRRLLRRRLRPLLGAQRRLGQAVTGSAAPVRRWLSCATKRIGISVGPAWG